MYIIFNKRQLENLISMLFSRPTQITINAGTELYLEGRVSLDLL